MKTEDVEDVMRRSSGEESNGGDDAQQRDGELAHDDGENLDNRNNGGGNSNRALSGESEPTSEPQEPDHHHHQQQQQGADRQQQRPSANVLHDDNGDDKNGGDEEGEEEGHQLLQAATAPDDQDDHGNQELIRSVLLSDMEKSYGGGGHDVNCSTSGNAEGEYVHVLAYLRQRGLHGAASDVEQWMRRAQGQGGGGGGGEATVSVSEGNMTSSVGCSDVDADGGGKMPAAESSNDGTSTDDNDGGGGGKMSAAARKTREERGESKAAPREESSAHEIDGHNSCDNEHGEEGGEGEGHRINSNVSSNGVQVPPRRQEVDAEEEEYNLKRFFANIGNFVGMNTMRTGRRRRRSVVRTMSAASSTRAHSHQENYQVDIDTFDVESGTTSSAGIRSQPGAYRVSVGATTSPPPSSRSNRRSTSRFRRARDRYRTREREHLDNIENAINAQLEGDGYGNGSDFLDATVETIEPERNSLTANSLGTAQVGNSSFTHPVSATAVEDVVVEASMLDHKGQGRWSKRRVVVVVSVSILVLVVAVIALSVTLTASGGGGSAAIAVDATASPTTMPTLGPSERLEVLADLFASISSADDLATVGTAQNRALQWIASEDGARVNAAYKDWLIQRYTLAVLYYATAGDELWERQHSFLSAEHECDWSVAVVGCDSDRRVVHINIHANRLKGRIPSELGSSLDRIETLNLADNDLSGTIPEQLYNLTRLTELNLWSNSISGTLSTRIGQLRDLTVLRLEVNDIEGQIPDEIYDMTSLTVLSLRQNEITGTFSSRFGEMSQLKDLALFGQTLEGTIPTELGRLTNLENLQISDLGLYGTIPTEMSKLTNLWRLAVSYNDLTGTVPHGFTNFTKMERIYFQQNRLVGDINFLCDAYGPIETFRADLAVVACDCCTCCK